MRGRALAELFRPAVNRARALGYSHEEIRLGLQRALTTKDRPRVVFVGSEQEFADRYTPLLAEALRDLLRDAGIPVSGIALELSAETRRELLGLPGHTRTVLVAERVNLAGMGHLIEQYWMPAASMRRVPADTRGLAEALRDAAIVIHSLRASAR